MPPQWIARKTDSLEKTTRLAPFRFFEGGQQINKFRIRRIKGNGNLINVHVVSFNYSFGASWNEIRNPSSIDGSILFSFSIGWIY